MQKLLLLIVFFALIVFTPAFINSTNAAGSTYYVATTGSDTNSGTLTSPFKTIPKGISTLLPGDTLYVRSGIYPSFSVTKSGTANNYLTIAGYASEKPHINSGTGIRLQGVSYVAVKGFEITGVSSVYGAAILITIDSGHAPKYNLIDNNLIHDNLGSKTHGIIINSGSYNRITNNKIYNNFEVGIRIQSNTGPAAYNEVTNNTVYHHVGDPPNSDGIAVSLPNTSYNLVKNNLVYDNADDGIDTWSSHHNTIIGNIVYGQRGGGDGNGIKLGGTETGGHNTVIGNISFNNKQDGFESNRNGGNIYYNNVAYGNGANGFDDSNMIASCTIDTCRSLLINNIGYNNARNFSASRFTAVSHNNIWYNDSGSANISYQGAGTFSTLASFYAASGNRLDNPNNGSLSSLQLNPRFVNPVGNDFTLQSTSPAINTGDPANPGQITAVGIPDIGAYEFGVTSVPTPTATPGIITIKELISNWLYSSNDQNGDQKINSLDFSQLVNSL